jgi:hypothetical protein
MSARVLEGHTDWIRTLAISVEARAPSAVPTTPRCGCGIVGSGYIQTINNDVYYVADFLAKAALKTGSRTKTD